MSIRARILVLAVALTAAGGFGCTKQRGPQLAYANDSTSSTAEEAFKDADKMLSKKYYEQAVEQFERLRNTFPFSKYAVEAELKIADALYAKGDYAEAADAYRTFARLHPKHEKIDYATFRVGLSLFKDAPRSVDRDQSSTELALKEFRRFLTRFPESEYSDKAAEFVAKGRQRLASKELYVGRFYYKDKAYEAGIPRFQTVVDRYPETDAARDALFLLGKSQFLAGKRDEALKTLEEYLNRYPEAESVGEARRMIRASGGTAEAKAEASATPE